MAMFIAVPWLIGAVALFSRCVEWLKTGYFPTSPILVYYRPPLTDWVGLNRIILFFYERDIVLALFLYPALILWLATAVGGWVNRRLTY